MLLGNKIRSLRDEQGILQRQVAAYLEIDTPMFGRMDKILSDLEGEEDLKLTAIETAKDELLDVNR